MRQDGEDAWSYAQRIFDLVFHRDIERVARIDKLWESRKPPTPLPSAAQVLGADAAAAAPAQPLREGTVLSCLQLNPRELRYFRVLLCVLAAVMGQALLLRNTSTSV